MKHGCWQWGDSGCPARLAPAGQGDPEEVLLAQWDRGWRGCDWLRKHLRPRLCLAALWWQPGPLCSGAAQPRLPDSLSFPAAHLHEERACQPSPSSLQRSLAKAASPLAAMVTGCCQRPGSLQEKTNPQSSIPELKRLGAITVCPAGALSRPDTPETCRAVLVSL